MEEKETTTLGGFPEEPKLEVDSPPLSPRYSDDDDEDDGTEPDDSDGEEEEGGSGAGVGAVRGGTVATGPPLKKGPWTPDEDKRLRTYVEANGEGNWNLVQRNAGLNRCGKSCRLRWANHLRPHLKKGPFSKEEEQKIIELHAMHGNKWARMAGSLPGRTDNEIKNFWNTRSKRLSKAGLDLYPDGLLSRVANQDMDCDSPEDSRGKKRPNKLSQGSFLEFDDIIFEKLDYKKRAENFLDPVFMIQDSLPVDGMNHPLNRHASSGIISGYSGSPMCEQFPHEAEKTCYTDINPGITMNHSVPFNNAIANGLPVLDGNFSTSGTIKRPMKMELPSFQHTSFESTNSWSSRLPLATPVEQADACIFSPSSVLKSESFPFQHNGLLDIMVQQGHVLGDHTKFQGVYEGLLPLPSYGCPLSPSSSGFGDSPLLYEFRTSSSPASVDALLRDGKHQAGDIFADKYLSASLDPCRPDASAEATFFNENSPCSEQPINGPLSALLFGDSCDEITSSATGDGHQPGLESGHWESMPGAHHMSESPSGSQQQL